MTSWLNIVGVSEAGAGALGPDLRSLIEDADIVIGVPRRLADLNGGAQQLIAWNGSLDDMVERITGQRGTPTVILASGDPNWFGIGATLSRHLTDDEFAMHPQASSFQLAAARLHWPMQALATLSLHGRDVATLHPHLLPRNRVLALTSDAGTLHEVRALLGTRGYGQSELAVLENLGGSDEKISRLRADSPLAPQVGDFYVLAIECVADEGAPLLPPVPGLPDSCFANDGQLTKREVRAIVFSRLSPVPGELLWDLGAGCGSVAIEWMRAARGARAICFEKNAARCEMIGVNARALGVPMLEVVNGHAPECFGDRSQPDAIFIGGDAGNEALFEAAFAELRPGGRLVASAVTLGGEAALTKRFQTHRGDLVRIGVSHLDDIGKEKVLRPRMDVTIWSMVKGAGS